MVLLHVIVTILYILSGRAVKLIDCSSYKNLGPTPLLLVSKLVGVEKKKSILFLSDTLETAFCPIKRFEYNTKNK